MNLSVVIPARNEDKFLGACLDSIEASAALLGLDVEVVVVINRCTDRTEFIAKERGCVVAREDAKCLSKIRNAGIRATTADRIVTIDADSTMDPDCLSDIAMGFNSKRYVGGAMRSRLERTSNDIATSCNRILLYLPDPTITFGGGGLWFRREAFDAVGGFDEYLCTVEDVDFARRLQSYGNATGRLFCTMRGEITTSCRKFDQFGDLLDPQIIQRIFTGYDQEVADEFYYEVER